MPKPVELKPCPFCGWYCVSVSDRSRKAVIEKWNTRNGVRPDGSPTPGKRGEELLKKEMENEK